MPIDFGGLGAEATFDPDKINNGVWVHLESAAIDPATGQTYPLYLKGNTAHPQRILVRSHRCQMLKDADAAQQKKGITQMRLARRKDKNKAIDDNMLVSDETRISIFLAALENFGANPGIQTLTPEDALAICREGARFDNIVQQTREAAYDDTLYLREGSAGNVAAAVVEKPATSATDQKPQDQA